MFKEKFSEIGAELDKINEYIDTLSEDVNSIHFRLEKLEKDNETNPELPSIKRYIKGLHGPSDPASWAYDDIVYSIYNTANIETAKILCPGPNMDQIERFNSIGVELLVSRIFYKFDQQVEPSMILSGLMNDIMEQYNAGVRYFELFNEPNIGHPHAPEGLGVTWNNGKEFGEYFASAVEFLRSIDELKDTKWGFPGLSPNEQQEEGLYPRSKFFAEALPYIREYADFICVHEYWDVADRMKESAQRIIDFCNQFPNTPIMVTEFSNPIKGVDKHIKGQEYAEFYKLMRSAPENLKATFAFLVSASSGWESEVWKDSPIPEIVKDV